MAKQITPFGGHFVGRLGTAVGAKLKGGEYVARSYQPQVKNPNTLRQQASRVRFKTSSSIVSKLAEVVNIGFAKAASGSRMYPRNMAVRDLIGNDVALQMTGVEISGFSFESVAVSKKNGIDTAPVLRYTAPSAGTPGSITLVNSSAYSALYSEGDMGIVVVAAIGTEGGDLQVMKVLKGAALGGVTVTENDALEMTGCTLIGFIKLMPTSKNSIPTDQWPWKYPSATSETVFVTTIQ